MANENIRALREAERRKAKNPWTKPGTQTPEKRPAQYSQDRSREPPTREQRERDYDGKAKTT